MKPISKDWTPEERIRTASAFLPGIPPSRNRATLESILRDPPSVLEYSRWRIEKVVAAFESETEPYHE